MLKCLIFLFIGFVVGCVVGISLMCMLRVAGQADRENGGKE